MSPKRILLTWIDPETEQPNTIVSELPITLGRDKSNTVALYSSLISRQHARLEEASGGILIKDMNSANGIQVNGSRVEQANITEADTFSIGPFTFNWEYDSIGVFSAVAAPAGKPIENDKTFKLSVQELKAALQASPTAETTAQPAHEATIQLSTAELQAALNPEPSAKTALLSVDELQALAQQGRGSAPQTIETNDGKTLQMTSDQMQQILAQKGSAGATIQLNVNEIQAFLAKPATAPSLAAKVVEEAAPSFPPAFFNKPIVTIDEIKKSGVQVDEITYLGVGGGLANYTWADHLVIFGANPNDIMTIGFEPKPYGRYRRLCLNSQIPDHERLRSDSGSTPDNIWGWPGYALREIWTDLLRGRLAHVAKILWQIFTEPVLSETYAPIAGRLYESIDREATRIGWDQMWRYGRVKAVRKTDDGRYVVAYSQTTRGHAPIHKFAIGQFVQLGVGYPGIKLLPDLKEYRERTEDFKQVVNAYEEHEHMYHDLEKNGGTVLVRGRGIVASRIIQRIYELRKKNPNIMMINVLRTPQMKGHRFQRAQRKVKNHWELQPMVFPRAAISGRLRMMLEEASEDTRKQYMNDWGGTTTQDRRDWMGIIEQGLKEGWYQIQFGNVIKVDRTPDGQIISTMQPLGQKGQSQIVSDYVMDATGLNAEIDDNPMLKDILGMYDLSKNVVKGRLQINKSFEVVGMENGKGRIFAAGAMALGGPFAAVDSFIGMQFVATRSIEQLIRLHAPGLKPLTPWRSVSQFIKWARGVQP